MLATLSLTDFCTVRYFTKSSTLANEPHSHLKSHPHLRHFLFLLFSCNICLHPYHIHSLRKKKNTKTMAPIRILIINPNTDQSMTDSLREPIESLGYNNVTSSLSLSQFLLSQPNPANSPDKLINKLPHYPALTLILIQTITTPLKKKPQIRTNDKLPN